MAYTVTMEKDLENKLEKIRSVNYKEYTRFAKKIEEIRNHASIMKNHKTRFNTFDKPLHEFKWIEINDNILIFTLDPINEKLHLCDYLPETEVFE